jgi:hypothetical protein
MTTTTTSTGSTTAVPATGTNKDTAASGFVIFVGFILFCWFMNWLNTPSKPKIMYFPRPVAVPYPSPQVPSSTANSPAYTGLDRIEIEAARQRGKPAHASLLDINRRLDHP